MRSMIPAMINMPYHFDLASVASRDAEKSKDIAKNFGIKRSFISYGKLLNCDGVDTIYITLPNSLHFRWVEKVQELGLHVLAIRPAKILPRPELVDNTNSPQWRGDLLTASF